MPEITLPGFREAAKKSASRKRKTSGAVSDKQLVQSVIDSLEPDHMP